MSIRLKVFLIITVIILAITASSVGISIDKARKEIITTLEGSMESVAKVANEYISGEFDSLTDEAFGIVQAFIKGVPTEELFGAVEQIVAFSDTFMAITVFNSAGRADVSYGTEITPENMARGEYGQQAFEGQRVISSTRMAPSGKLVFDIFIPIDESSEVISNSRIVAFTVSGMYFCEKIEQLIFENGKITMGDKEGTVIASRDRELVTMRGNLNDLLVSKGRNYNNAVKVIQNMTSGKGETGAARFSIYYEGKEAKDAITAYMPLTASNQGWFIAVTTPVEESAYSKITGFLLFAGFIFLGLGMLAAAFASGAVAKPFYQIEKQNVLLTELNEQVKSAAVAKTNFLANMSFDMRTPLNAVIGLSELSITKRGVPSDVKGYLDRIYGSGVTLMGVVNDLLDLSNMESGKFGMMSAEYDLPNFINDTIKANTLHIGSKPITFRILPEEKLPARLIGDTLRVRQVFSNLLSNAFRHTSVGTVEWKISTEREGDSVWLVSSVSDTGVGIKPENLDKLFIDYNRLDTDRMRHRDGASGMGLTLTKKILGLMDGDITVESTLGKGSIFSVRMRQKYVGDAVISSEQLDSFRNFKYVEEKQVDKADIQRIQLPGKRVLVVDDVELNFEIAQGMIEPYGITVDCLANGQEAVEIIRLDDPHYDAIFMSRWMSEMDGKEAVRIIRSEIGSEYAKAIPIIALTTNTVIGNKDVFLNWGFQDVLSKPLDIRHLDKVIHAWLAK